MCILKSECVLVVLWLSSILCNSNSGYVGRIYKGERW